MTFQSPNGALCSVPVSWTDIFPMDPYQSIGKGKSLFRVEDLLELEHLVAGLKKERKKDVK